MRTLFLATAVVATLLEPGSGIPRWPEPESVTFHDMGALPKTPYGAFPDMRAVLTDSSSVALATIPPHWKQTLHRHAHDQITIGRAGAIEFSIDGVRHQLGSHAAGLSSANVEHGMVNDADHTGVVIEYQPVLRRDWLPPHPQPPPQSLSMEPRHVPQDQQVSIDFDPSSSGWADLNGARAKILSGETIQATFWDLSKSSASVDVSAAPSTRERLVVVLHGHVSSAIGSVRREIGPEMLLEVHPSTDRLTLRSLGEGAAMVVVFETLPH
jgi:quercetin dioxygenase-like cupin family protein